MIELQSTLSRRSFSASLKRIKPGNDTIITLNPFWEDIPLTCQGACYTCDARTATISRIGNCGPMIQCKNLLGQRSEIKAIAMMIGIYCYVLVRHHCKGDLPCLAMICRKKNFILITEALHWRTRVGVPTL